ncbi:inositol hexakisphosphate and diphosphoinositol-pentakisphosphate kinase 2 isoform X4 [Hydra vulgaris]|uniref:Inositol hexakisphosphate and diphosphoinositol-pentakisphosphate kinase n=1 Tax=Hydra vulgaris TaxID=6087 RepID=A0ABM4BID1_HYDVU
MGKKDHFKDDKEHYNHENKSIGSKLNRKVIVGICAVSKKTNSGAMKEILKRLKLYNLLKFIIFSDNTILEQPIESWPIVDALISFYSSGFPLDKAVSYAKLRKPFVLNDLEMQSLLLDRREVYKLLYNNRIKTPRYAIFERDENNYPVSGEEIIETDDTIIVNGVTFTKPFVEKPVNAEDHNVFIYYPSGAGGGCQVLFRKIGNKSSLYSSHSQIRRKGSFIYEDFMRTDGTDVKVYTVGDEYAHAEARKSPVLDGKVDRTADGKEIRYPVILSPFEKMIAFKVCRAFKQTVCGFDLLRTDGKSLVCDVNGFSFVKTSQKYYDDCAQLLAKIILKNFAPRSWPAMLANVPDGESIKQSVAKEVEKDDSLELCCLIAIMRHGDRTPKQKMKMVVTHKLFHDIFIKYGGNDEASIKLKKPAQLQEMLCIFCKLIDGDVNRNYIPIDEDRYKLTQMKSVLEMYGHFDGINRKVQIKSMSDIRNANMVSKLRGRNGLEQDKFKGDLSLLLIVKWGGELTPMGKKQAEDLGRAYRCLYPSDGCSMPGGGLLRLHSTYRHDLKIYSSDEGRVEMTAAAFAKGLLDLEGELTPILVSLVKNDKYISGMLDTPSSISCNMQRVKSRIHDKLRSKEDFTEEDIAAFTNTKSGAIAEAMRVVKNPQKKCEKVYKLVCNFTNQLRELCKQQYKNKAYHGEGLVLMMHRWEKLQSDFKIGDEFDMSLIPDIYDCVKYDYIHNISLNLKNLPELYADTKPLADIVIPQEYGITSEDKIKISKEICSNLLLKIKSDLNSHVSQQVNKLDPSASQGIDSPNTHVRTRLYVTSESHVHSVVNAIKEGNLFKNSEEPMSKQALEYLNNTAELNYLTQIVIMKYEDLKANPESDERFRIEILFSFTVDFQNNLQTSLYFKITQESRDIRSLESYLNVDKDRKSLKQIKVNAGEKCPDNNEAVKRLQQESNANNYASKRSFNEDLNLLVETQNEQTAILEINAKSLVPDICFEGVKKKKSFSYNGNLQQKTFEMPPTLNSLHKLHNCLRLKQVNSFIDQLTTGCTHNPRLSMVYEFPS